MLPVETADEVVGIGQQAEEPVVEDTDHETTMQAEEPETREDAIVRQAGTNCIFRKKTVLVGMLKDGRLACP